MMTRKNIFLQYLEWYFIDQTSFILKVWRNFLKFNLNYFSIPLLIRTLFSPWRRYKASPGRRFDIKRWLEACFSNLIFRVLGAIMRTMLILLGLGIEILIFLGGLILVIFWLTLPAFLILGFVFSLRQILL